MTEIALGWLRQLALFGAILMPLEILLPIRSEQRLLRRGLATDLAWSAITPALVVGVGAAMLAGLAALAQGVMPGALRAALVAQPWGAQVVEIVLLSELGMYWAHRASHAHPWLWRLHAVHHSPREMDWLSAHRQHPVEHLWHLGVANLPVVALGFPTETILGFIFFQKLHTAWVHANLRLPEGGWERWLAGPRFHRWHHARWGGAGNFSSLLPVWDALFGTLRLPSGHPEALGVEEPVPDGLVGQLLHPLKPQRISRVEQDLHAAG
ncbi:MAG: sterol desaturase family protein [Alphaproteobacteria bacterium]|nr:sterol desaturase family protein [Alphaproteobacteria bacterium]